MSKETFERYSTNVHGNEIKKQKSTKFSRKWGIHAIDLAEREKLSPDAIHCRVRLFGSPWQRRSKPTVCEELTGFTAFQLAMIIDLHPITVDNRIRLYNNPFVEMGDRADVGITRRPYNNGVHWSKQPAFRDNQRAWKSWLAPEHPCWAEWKSKRTKDLERMKIEAVIIKQDVLKQRERAEQENSIC